MLCKPWNGRRTGTRLQAAEVDGDVESEGGGGRLTMMYLRVGLAKMPNELVVVVGLCMGTTMRKESARKR